MAARQPKLFVAFKRAGGYAIEQIAGWFGKYVHCEVVLRYPTHYEAFSSYMNGGVRPRREWPFDPAIWTLVPADGLDVQKVIEFCKRSVSHNVEYDMSGAACSVMPLPIKWFVALFVDDEESYFCSEFTLRALCAGGFVTDARPQLVSPTGLWHLMTHAPKAASAGAKSGMRGLVL